MKCVFTQIKKLAQILSKHKICEKLNRQNLLKQQKSLLHYLIECGGVMSYENRDW